MQCEVSSRKALHAGATCVTCECRSRGTPEVLGTMSRVCRERGIHFAKAKPPEGHEEESAGRLLPSAEKAPADEANGASVWARAGTSEGATEGCTRIHHLLNSYEPLPGICGDLCLGD